MNISGYDTYGSTLQHKLSWWWYTVDIVGPACGRFAAVWGRDSSLPAPTERSGHIPSHCRNQSRCTPPASSPDPHHHTWNHRNNRQTNHHIPFLNCSSMMNRQWIVYMLICILLQKMETNQGYVTSWSNRVRSIYSRYILNKIILKPNKLD